MRPGAASRSAETRAPAPWPRRAAPRAPLPGARSARPRPPDRALAYERSDPGIERFELRTRRRRFGHRLRPRLLELGTRLRQCRSGRFERVRPYLQFATRLVELRLRRRSDDLRGRAHGFELG